jgi:hypothetical protein
MVVMSSTAITNGGSIQGISHKVKNGDLILTLCCLVDVSNISTMMLIMMDLHGRSINVGLKSIKVVLEIRNRVRIGSYGGCNASSEGYSLLEEGTTAGSSF